MAVRPSLSGIPCPSTLRHPASQTGICICVFLHEAERSGCTSSHIARGADADRIIHTDSPDPIQTSGVPNARTTVEPLSHTRHTDPLISGDRDGCFSASGPGGRPGTCGLISEPMSCIWPTDELHRSPWRLPKTHKQVSENQELPSCPDSKVVSQKTFRTVVIENILLVQLWWQGPTSMLMRKHRGKHRGVIRWWFGVISAPSV